MKTQFLSRTRNAGVFGLRREAERHAAFERPGGPRKAVSPLRSTTALQILAPLRLCAFALILLPLCLPATTNDLTSALQRGLFEEEANRNLEAAAQAYRDVSAQFDKDRKVAATAVFRLGEIYRKQGKTNEAVVQYERIVREFSDQETLATLSRQNLTSLGRSFQSNATVALSPAARLEQRRLLEAEIKLLETKAKSEKLLYESGRADLTSTIATQRELLALKRQLVAMSMDATPEDIRAEQGRLLDEEIALVEQKLAGVRATAGDREYASVLSDTERELLALKRQRIALVNEPLQATTSEASAALVTDDEEKEIRRIQAMIQNSPDLINAGQNPPIYAAVEAGYLSVVRFLLERGANVNVPTLGKTPLHIAAERGQKAMAELLLTNGADVNAKYRADNTYRLDRTPLHFAAAAGYEAVADVLLAHKADVNARDAEGHTPLHLAVRLGNDLVPRLLNSGADANAENNSGISVLSQAVSWRQAENVKKLLAAKADPNGGKTDLPLFASVQAGEPAILDELLRAGADIGLRDPLGRSPLHWAAEKNDVKATKLLLAAKTDVNEVDARGRTALSCAVGNTNVVKLLLEAKADPNLGTTESPLLLAVRGDDAALTEMLLRAGANPNQVTECDLLSPAPMLPGVPVGVSTSRPQSNNTLRTIRPSGKRAQRTPLQVSVLEKYPAMVKLLLQFKADAKAKSPEGGPLIFDALDSAEILSALLEAGASPNATNQNGETLLHLAVAVQHKEVVAALLTHKAEVNATGSLGITSLRLATSNYRNKEIADLLRQHGGLEDVPDFSTIRVKRGDRVSPIVVFRRDTNALNRFTLFEVIRHCDYVGVPRAGFGFAAPPSLPFPDLSRIRILRPVGDKSAEHKEIPALVITATNTFDCTRDMWVEFGDVIDIPEREHSLAEMNSGLTSAQSDSLDQCLKRKVTFVVKGQSSEIKLGGHPASAWLSQALRLAEVQSILRSSSDLSRVKVKRTDPQTKQPSEVVMDVDLLWRKQQTTVSEDVWLRDGDVIEVPDKP